MKTSVDLEIEYSNKIANYRIISAKTYMKSIMELFEGGAITAVCLALGVNVFRKMLSDKEDLHKTMIYMRSKNLYSWEKISFQEFSKMYREDLENNADEIDRLITSNKYLNDKYNELWNFVKNLQKYTLENNEELLKKEIVLIEIYIKNFIAEIKKDKSDLFIKIDKVYQSKYNYLPLDIYDLLDGKTIFDV